LAGWLGAAGAALAIAAGSVYLAGQSGPGGAALVGSLGLGGIIGGAIARGGYGAFVSIMVTALPASVIGALMYATDLWGFHQIISAHLGEVVATYKTSGYVPSQISNVLPTVQDLWLHIYPLLLTLALVASSCAMYLLAEVLAPRLGRPELVDGRFRCWRMPDGFAWLLALGLALMLINRAPFGTVGTNLTWLMVAAYGIAGFAVMRFFLIAWGVAVGVQLLILGGMIVFGVLSQVPLVPAFSVTLGFLDTWADFRGLTHPPLSAGEGRSIQR
jgi:hypothetical protein